jgi:hypothetical protein
MFFVISNLMAVNDTVLEEGDKHGSITKGLVQIVDTYAAAARLPSDGRLVIGSDNLALEARDISPIEFTVLAEGLSYTPPETKNVDVSVLNEIGEVSQVC